MALAESRPTTFVFFGLWGTALVLLAVGIGVLWFDARRSSRAPRRVAITLAVVVGVGLMIRGVALEVALWSNLGDLASAVGPTQTKWSLAGWNPWFALGGLAFLAVGRRWHRSNPPTAAPPGAPPTIADQPDTDNSTHHGRRPTDPPTHAS